MGEPYSVFKMPVYDLQLGAFAVSASEKEARVWFLWLWRLLELKTPESMVPFRYRSSPLS